MEISRRAGNAAPASLGGVTSSGSARTTTYRKSRLPVVGLLVVVAAIGAWCASPWIFRSLSTAAEAIDLVRGGNGIGVADGVVPDGTTVFDAEVPGVANLNPAVLGALRRAAAAAASQGIRFVVTSGWRSADYEDELLREAIVKYGSAEEAASWVATPSTSAHVSGEAVDLGSSDATIWLAQHGARYGLCQIYRNEPWHYELRPKAVAHGCPPMYADPTADPRMEQ